MKRRAHSKIITYRTRARSTAPSSRTSYSRANSQPPGIASRPCGGPVQPNRTGPRHERNPSRAGSRAPLRSRAAASALQSDWCSRIARSSPSHAGIFPTRPRRSDEKLVFVAQQIRLLPPTARLIARRSARESWATTPDEPSCVRAFVVVGPVQPIKLNLLLRQDNSRSLP